MQHEIIKAIIWENYRRGQCSEEDLLHDLSIIEQDQMDSIQAKPQDIPKPVLRVPKWQLN